MNEPQTPAAPAVAAPVLTAANYHDPQWDHLLTPSQLKEFNQCQFGWYHRYRLHTPPPVAEELDWKSPMVVGQMVDALLTNPAAVDGILAKYPPFNKLKAPYAGYATALRCAEAVKKHTMAAGLLASARFQVAAIGSLWGVPVKALPDIVVGRSVWDLKTCDDLDKTEYSVEHRRHVPFWYVRRYHIQAVFYSDPMGLDPEGLILVDKDEMPMVETRTWPAETLDLARRELFADIERFKESLAGIEIEPEMARRCERCMWCRAFPVSRDYHNGILYF